MVSTLASLTPYIKDTSCLLVRVVRFRPEELAVERERSLVVIGIRHWQAEVGQKAGADVQPARVSTLREEDAVGFLREFGFKLRNMVLIPDLRSGVFEHPTNS